MIKFKKGIIVLITLFLVLISSNFVYGEEDINAKYITPSLKITNSGIKFDDSGAENAFKKSQDEVSGINKILEEYSLLINVGTGIVSLTLIGIFIINFIKLGNSKGNPQERQKAITGLIVTGVATAMAGSVTILTKLFFNFIQ